MAKLAIPTVKPRTFRGKISEISKKTTPLGPMEKAATKRKKLVTAIPA